MVGRILFTITAGHGHLIPLDSNQLARGISVVKIKIKYEIKQHNNIKGGKKPTTAVVLVAGVAAVGNAVAAEIPPDTRTIVTLKFVRATRARSQSRDSQRGGRAAPRRRRWCQSYSQSATTTTRTQTLKSFGSIQASC